jgi:hypothetical protein
MKPERPNANGSRPSTPIGTRDAKVTAAASVVFDVTSRRRRSEQTKKEEGEGGKEI